MGRKDNKEVEEAEKKILRWIPVSERDVAKRIIYKAARLGFTNIQLNPPFDGYDPSIQDIVGTSKDGYLIFLYGKI